MQTRRQFVAGTGVAAAATVLAPQEAVLGQGRRARNLLRGGRFSEGVMSGDPTPRSIVLWTRVGEVTPGGTVRLEVARDREFRRVVARRLIGTDGNVDHTVKAQVKGLRPNEQYFYRFETRDEQSPVGRFKTAPPPDSNLPVRFAFFSCSEWSHGFFNAYAAMAEEDLDFVVCLGDYIYEAPLDPNSETGPYTIVRPDPVGIASTVQQYREKYRLYRSDPALRAVHRNFPMVTIWDDHEVEDNYAGNDPSSEDWDPNRRRAGYRAWWEFMPVTRQTPRGDRIYRNLRFGRNVDLLMLDQRQYRDNQPCNDEPGPPCPERDLARDYLGRNQMRWVKDRLESSNATWKMIGNELPIFSTRAGESYIPEYDAWGNGYPTERQELLTHIRDKRIRDVAFITGDVHYFAAADVRVDEADANTVVAHDFVGGSISSASPGESRFDLGGGLVLQGNDQNPDTPGAVMDALEGFNPWIDAADIDHHGYAVVEATRRELDVRMRRMATVKQRSTRRLSDMRWTVDRGDRSILGQNKSTDF